MAHHLLIPVHGDLELIDTPRSARAVLEERGSGVYVGLDFEVDGKPGGVMSLLVSDRSQVNRRAEEALVWLCGVYMLLTGDVVFTDVSPDLVAEMVRDID